ncbi:unnamed protein product [Dibothriocephalus latus]|uniref:Uncharacterized protein n=1 Tax=Dibothriocephalus latus TaxID=60516 RepID=A0A3P7M718_DIBLA|nr:unnamed protein product [Dibothriocephalus latus]
MPPLVPEPGSPFRYPTPTASAISSLNPPNIDTSFRFAVEVQPAFSGFLLFACQLQLPTLPITPSLIFHLNSGLEREYW